MDGLADRDPLWGFFWDRRASGASTAASEDKDLGEDKVGEVEIEETGTQRFDGELEFARGCGGRCVGRDEGILVSTLFKTTGVGAVADLVFQLPSRVGGERFSQGLNMDESDISCASPMSEDRRRNGRSGGGKKVGGPMGCVRTKSKRRRSRGSSRAIT